MTRTRKQPTDTPTMNTTKPPSHQPDNTATAKLNRNNRPKPTRAQIALSNKLPIPMHRNARGEYSDIIGNGRDGGIFSRLIAADCKSVIYVFDGDDDPPLSVVDALLDEAQRQSDESRIPGVLEVPTPGGRTLRFPITPAPLCEVTEPTLTKNTI